LNYKYEFINEAVENLLHAACNLQQIIHVMMRWKGKYFDLNKTKC